MSVQFTPPPTTPESITKRREKSSLDALPLERAIEIVLNTESYNCFDCYLDGIQTNEIVKYLDNLISRNKADIVSIIYNKYDDLDFKFIDCAIKYDAESVLDLFVTDSNVNQCVKKCIKRSSEECLELILDSDFIIEETNRKFVKACQVSSNRIVDILGDYILDNNLSSNYIISSLIKYNRYNIFLKFVKIVDDINIFKIIKALSGSNEVDGVDYLKELIRHYSDINHDEYTSTLLYNCIENEHLSLCRYILVHNMIGNKSCFCKINPRNQIIIDTIIESKNHAILELILDYLPIHAKYAIKLLDFLCDSYEYELLKTLCNKYSFIHYKSILYNALYKSVQYNYIDYVKFFVNEYDLKLYMVTITTIGNENIITYDTDPCLYNYDHDLLSISLNNEDEEMTEYLADYINISNNNYKALKMATESNYDPNFYTLVEKVNDLVKLWFKDIITILYEGKEEYDFICDIDHNSKRIHYICNLLNPIQLKFNPKESTECPICMTENENGYYFKCNGCKKDNTHLMCNLKYWYTNSTSDIEHATCTLCRHKTNINNLNVVHLNT